MAIPSGSGTEVLKRGYFKLSDSTETAILTGVANHIYTVLSVTFCETAGSTDPETIGMHLDPSNAGTEYEILSRQNVVLGANATFVFNDRLVLSGTDRLKVRAGAGCAIDIVISFIDQDWS